MKTAIIYTSTSGNTRALTERIAETIRERVGGIVEMFDVVHLNVEKLYEYDAIVIGSYTWGNGVLPKVMKPFYDKLNEMDLSDKVTAVFGTGETNYRYYCRAVDIFRDLLHEISDLAVTLKVEQLYQNSDLARVEKFCDLLKARMELRNPVDRKRNFVLSREYADLPIERVFG